MVERGKLGLAAQCLERAAALAPQQDYVHRHLAIVKARINRLPPEQRDTQVLEEFFWEGNTFDGSLNDPVVGQFLEKTDSSFSNPTVVHNHVGSKAKVEDASNRLLNSKVPSKSPRVLENLNVDPKDKSEERLMSESPANVKSTSDASVLDDILSTDLTEMEIARMHGNKAKLSTSEKFNHSAGNSHSGSIKKAKVSAFS